MEWIFILKLTLLILSIILCAALVVFIIQVIQIACSVKKMVNRIEFLTDIKEWMSLFKKWPRRKKKNS